MMHEANPGLQNLLELRSWENAIEYSIKVSSLGRYALQADGVLLGVYSDKSKAIKRLKEEIK